MPYSFLGRYQRRYLAGKKATVVLFVIIAILAISAPIAISLYLAWQQSLDEQKFRVAELARDVMRRVDDSVAQLWQAAGQLEKAHAADPCSAENIALMARLAIAAEQVLGIGYVANDRLICTSFDKYPEGIAVGPADYVSANGIYIRSAVTLPAVPSVKFILVTLSSGYTLIVHPILPLDVFTDDPDLSLGIVGYSARRPIDTRGYYDPHWLQALGDAHDVMFLGPKNVVALRRSENADIVAFAASPRKNIAAGLARNALILVPVGTLAAAILAIAILYVARQQLGLPSMIKLALRRGEFFVEYQPVVDLRTGKWVGAEALLRWRPPYGDLVRSDIFIPAAEDSGLISLITDHLLEIIAKDTTGLFAEYPEFHIAINLAASDLQSVGTVDSFTRLIEQTGARPENFIAEATERELINESAANSVMRRLRATGIRVAIDDFGTGYSSLSYLRTFAVDFLKIDKSFIDTIGADTVTSQVVGHIVEMAKSLKLEIIAEGVETNAQRNFLRERGVQYAQGWLFAKSIPIGELRSRLKGFSA
jgi:sensor c-di-GMP phosphodiesterase-like protein